MYESGDIRAATDAQVYRRLVEVSTDILVRAGLDGTILYASPSCQILGYAPEELIGRSATFLLHPEDLPRFADRLSALRHGVIEPAADRAHRYRTKSGDWVWLEGNPQLLRDTAGRPVEIINAFRDVTERKRAEADLARPSACSGRSGSCSRPPSITRRSARPSWPSTAASSS